MNIAAKRVLSFRERCKLFFLELRQVSKLIILFISRPESRNWWRRLHRKCISGSSLSRRVLNHFRRSFPPLEFEIL